MLPWKTGKVGEGGESKVAKRERNEMMMDVGKRELVMSFGRLEW